MKGKSRYILLLTFFLAAGIGQPASAQLSFGGLLDLEMRKGGADSAPYINQTPTDKFTIYTPAVRIFGQAFLTEDWFVELALQSDHYEGEHLSPLFFSAANVNWMPLDDSQFMITAGRFVTPYGRYSRQLFSSENPFVHLPLSHAWNLPADRVRGFYTGRVSYDDVPGQSLLYQRMYTQGLMLSNSLLDGRFQYELAATLSSASGHFQVGMHSIPAFTGRIELSPAIWSELGLSLSYGPYMVRDSLNMAFSDGELREFTQTLIGADLTLSYHYYTLSFDLNYNRWKAPYITESGVAEADDLVTPVWHYTVEFHSRLAFMPGAYSALRLDFLRPDDLRTVSYDPPGFPVQWAPDLNRMEFVAGYNVNTNVILKLSYLTSSMPDSDWDINDDVVSLQLSLLF